MSFSHSASAVAMRTAPRRSAPQRRDARRAPGAGHLVLAAGVAAACVTGSMPERAASVSDTLAMGAQIGRAVKATAGPMALAATSPATLAVGKAAAKPPVIAFQPAAPQSEPAIAFKLNQGYYDQIRSRMRWVDVRYGENRLKTPDLGSRMLLAQSAAQKAGLNEVGLNWADVYGIINAETSWIPRMGASKDGTPNLGIAQFEPATAKALGLKDPHDPVEAVHVAALHLKQAAAWSAKRLAKLNLDEEERARKLREGVSIYYNLSTKGRNAWNGMNTRKLPIETQRHIANARRGANEASTIAERLRAAAAGSEAQALASIPQNGG